jgi:hypothetical protein
MPSTNDILLVIPEFLFKIKTPKKLKRITRALQIGRLDLIGLACYYENKIKLNQQYMDLILDLLNEQKDRQEKLRVSRGVNRNTDESPEPTAAEMASTLANSMLNWAKNGFKTVDDQILKKRMTICWGCEFWDKYSFAGTGRCTKCGCSTQAKLRLAHEKCPINLWGALDV